MIDFLVIGGGISGTSVGARLSALGHVVVLERESALAYHASGRSAAMFEENYGSPSTVALNTASRDYHFTENGGVVTPRGLMLIGTADNTADFDADLVSLQMDVISRDDAINMVPILNDTVTRAAYHANAWDIDTDKLVQDFARTIRGAGGSIRTSSEVTAITRTAAGWDIRLGDTTLQARNVVNAAGAWVDEIAALAGIAPIGIMPLRRSMARIPAPAGHDVSLWPMLFGPGEKHGMRNPTRVR